MSFQLADVVLAEQAEHENTTTEGSMYQYTFPAGFWQAGKVVRATLGAIVNDNNSTDTLTVLIRFGDDGSTLSNDDAIATSAAVDAADADVHSAIVLISCRSVDAATGDCICVAMVHMNDPDATGTISVDGYGPVVLTTFDAGAASYLTYAADWSVAHADNEVACVLAVVEEVV